MAEENQESTGEAAGGKKSNKMLIIVIVAVLLIGGAGAGGFFFLTSAKKAEEHAGEEAAAGGHEAAPAAGGHNAAGGVAPNQTVFYELPEMTVNLSSQGKTGRYLRLKVNLELARPGDVEAVERVLPRIVDDFQVYLRELRAEDLKGSAGMYRLKEALLLRANQAAQPVEINSVLFKEMLVQ
ncbi:MAG: flagellar basal body protein FliL [Proteobacteria bacterium]|nr:flagellar basal body protein FliL [Pseudomonadota bacterium]